MQRMLDTQIVVLVMALLLLLMMLLLLSMMMMMLLLLLLMLMLLMLMLVVVVVVVSERNVHTTIVRRHVGKEGWLSCGQHGVITEHVEAVGVQHDRIEVVCREHGRRVPA
jgi:cell division protein FtsW (lipid II flippase)